MNTELKVRNFIEELHAIWLTDRFSFDEYLNIAWGHMLYRDVKWQERPDFSLVSVNENGDLITKPSPSVEDEFEFKVNNNGADKFEVFEAACLETMDFSSFVLNYLNRAA